MVKASHYEREFIAWASQIGMVARIAASGTLNTIVGDLIVIPHKSFNLPPIIVEVKSTHMNRFYTSRDYAKIDLLRRSAEHFNFIPLLAVRFIRAGWKLVDLRKGIPVYVDPEGAFMIPYARRTLADWLSLKDAPNKKIVGGEILDNV